MALILDLVTLIACVISFGVADAIAIGGGLFALSKKMGPPDEYGAYEFDTSDKAATQEFLVRCLLHGFIASGAALLIGFLLNKMAPYFFKQHGFVLGVLLFFLHTAAAFLPAWPLHKVDVRRAAILTAFPTVLFLIFYPWVLADLIR